MCMHFSVEREIREIKHDLEAQPGNILLALAFLGKKTSC